MKKFYFSMLIIASALSLTADAQLNYLFSACKKLYVPVRNGIHPTLVTNLGGDLGDWTADDEGFANVPIGFRFNYNGKIVNTVNVCVNGFVTLGDTITRRTNSFLWVNRLDHGPFGFPGHKPVIAPFWDDLDLINLDDLVYKTSGRYPFRVFTVEWKKIKWTFESTNPSLSFQLKLYETTNIIEFHYRDEGGTPYIPRAFASIGITSSYNNRGFISLQSASLNPSVSLVRSYDSLKVKPATNQVYRFIPALLKIPAPLQRSVTYTNKSVNFKLHSGGYNSYEYAITRSPLIPASGTSTNSSDITVGSLQPATTYYIYARSKWFHYFRSQWTCDSITTAVNPVETPYHVGGNPAVYPYLPAELRIQDFKDTDFAAYPNSEAVWNGITDFPNAGDTSLWALNTLYGIDADSWVFTPGLKLKKGKTYQLKFGYLSFASQSPGPGELSSIEVKLGKANGAAAMTSGTLFKKTDILTDFNEEGWINFQDTVIEITPRTSDIYYFGFHNLTTMNNGMPGPVPVIGNISIGAKPPSVVNASQLALDGRTNSTDNYLNWKGSKKPGNAQYEIERSEDGIHFSRIASLNADAAVINQKSNTAVRYRIVRNAQDASTLTAGKTISKAVAEMNLMKQEGNFQLQKSMDGISFTNIVPATGTAITASRHEKISEENKLDFIDRLVTGLNYYRLRQTDKKGNVIYSNTIRLEANEPEQSKVTRIYPNPVKNVLNISVSARSAGKMNLLATDLSGRVLLNKTIETVPGQNILQVPVNTLPAGTYLLKINCADGCAPSVRKFIKD